MQKKVKKLSFIFAIEKVENFDNNLFQGKRQTQIRQSSLSLFLGVVILIFLLVFGFFIS